MLILNFKKYQLIAALVLVMIFISTDFTISAEKKKAKLSKEYTIFPDEYSELDGIPVPSSTKDENVLRTLEKSRQKYLQALILIEKGDTVNASKYFEDAIAILNHLVNYPGIEQNEDFTDLAQSIIDDYESFIQNVNDLSPNSSLFIMRDKIFQEVDKAKPVKTNIQSMEKKPEVAKDEKIPQTIFTIPLVDNEFVQKSIQFLMSEKGKKFFNNVIARGGRWMPMLKRIAKEEGMPEEIIYLAMIESGLNPTIVSKAKAVGMWQFIRETGAMYGLNKGGSLWLDERRDPEKATRAAMRHLKDLFNDLGDWHLALASYNCGVNGVKRSINKSNIEKPDFWQVRQFLPKETRNYVPFYIATAKVAMAPESYGFNVKDIQLYPEFRYDSYTLNEPVSLKALAKCLDLNVEEIQALNPELISVCTPPDAKEYRIRIPEGSKQKFIINFATLTQEEKLPWINHKVANGETIGTIADMYGVSSQAIISTNDLPEGKNKLKKGITLRIPIDQKSNVEDLAQAETKESENKEKKEVSAENKEVKSVESPSNDKTNNAQPVENKETASQTENDTKSDSELTPEGNYLTHIVKNNETLYSIAQKYGVRLADLRNLNDIPYDKDNIPAGKRLKISFNNRTETKKEPQITKLTPNKAFIKHQVRPGETLAQIADDYNVSIESIRQLNNLTNKNSILAGESLKVPATKKNTQIPQKTVASNSNSQQKKVVHKVKKGESLGSIAGRYGVTEQEIKRWNPKSVTGNKVFSGSRLKIYEDAPAVGGSVSSTKKVNKVPKYYTVKKGESLNSIADKFGVSVESIKKRNKGVASKLKKGQQIRLQ
jgi:membrane-bound lytic murein transglycosylase D